MGLKRGRERESKVNWWEGKNAVAVGRPSVHPSIGGACFSVASFRFIDDVVVVVVVVVDSLDSPSLRLPLIHLGDSWRNGGNMGTRRRQKEGRIAQSTTTGCLLSSPTIPLPLVLLLLLFSDQKWPSREITSKSLSFGTSCTWRDDLPMPCHQPHSYTRGNRI